MKETALLKIALICSLIGLLVLYFISTKIEVKDYRPILNKNIGEDVKLSGTITKISDRGDVVFVELNQENPITIVIFQNNKNISLKNNDYVEIFGTVQEYNRKNEIIADKIRVIR